MADFKKIFEDLASGRPAKKPVSGNLLKQRAKENEKALKSGFMKMPDYVKKKFNEELDNTFMKKRGEQLTPKEKHRANQQYKQKARDEIKKRLQMKKVEEAKEYCSCDCPCGKAICEECGKPHRKEDIKESSSWLQRTADTWNDHADHPHPKVQKHIKAAEKAYNNQDHEAFHHHTNRAADHAYALRQKKKSVKEDIRRGMPFVGTKDTPGGKGKVRNLTVLKNKGVPLSKLRPQQKNVEKKSIQQQINKEDKNWPRPFTKDERQEFLDKAHKEAGYKKVSGTGIKKVKGGYARKTTYTKEGIERDPKSNSFNRTKRKETTVRIGQKRDKKTGKMVDVMGKSSAPQGLPTMREQQMQIVTNLDFNEGLTNLVSRGLEKVRSSIKQAEKKHGPVDPAKRKIANPVSGDNIRKRLESQKKRKN